MVRQFLFATGIAAVALCSTAWGQSGSAVDSLLEKMNASGDQPASIVAILSQRMMQLVEPHERARVHDRIAAAYRELDISDSAAVHAWNVLRLAPEDNVLRVRAYSLLGFIAFQSAAWDRGAEYYSNAARLYTVLDDKPGQLDALMHLAKIDEHLLYPEAALSKYERAKVLAVELGDAVKESQLSFQLAVVLRSLGRFRDAEEYLKRSQALSSGDSLRLTQVALEWGRLHEDRLEYREAKSRYEQALHLSRKVDPFPAYNQLINLHVMLNAPDSAVLFADSSEVAAHWKRDIRQLRECYRSRYQLAEFMHDSAAAYDYLLRFKSFDDSVRSEETARSLRNARHELFLGASEASVRTAELQARLEDLGSRGERNQKVWIMLATGFGLASALLLGMLHFTTRRGNEKLRIKTEEAADLASKNAKVFAVLAHDLQGPVSTFDNLSRSIPSLLKEAKPDETRAIIRNFHHAAQELQQTLHELVDWAVTQSGTMPFKPEVFSCSKLAEQVKEELQPWADEHNVTTMLLVPEGVTTFADRATVKIVMRTLLFNAIRFSREGETVTLFSGRKEELITMGVKDNGPGIDTKELRNLLSWDQEGGKVREKGVGLPLCRELIRRNNGDLHVESQPGQGSTFFVTLPEHPPAGGNF